ncbi:MAG: hypothetical protein DRM98_00345 [Thermoplasmata archaeon]|nr:MAG: hypothetical protein DRM98_00345 [Thermoplasmata archaeon]
MCFITGCAKKKPIRKPPAPLTKLHQSIMVLLPISKYKTLFIYKVLEERKKRGMGGGENGKKLGPGRLIP